MIKNMMHEPVRAQYPMFSVIEALIILINISQYENENFLDYVKIF